MYLSSVFASNATNKLNKSANRAHFGAAPRDMAGEASKEKQQPPTNRMQPGQGKEHDLVRSNLFPYHVIYSTPVPFFKMVLPDYNQHDCDRICVQGEKPRVCQFKMVVELYNTMSKVRTCMGGK